MQGTQSLSKNGGSVLNVPKNLIVPFNSVTRITGSATKVFVEVFVAKVLRKLLSKKDPFSIMDLVLIHTFSLPFVGAFNTFREEGKLDSQNAGTKVWESALTGASEIPAAFVGYWANKIFNQGFVGPWIGLYDILWLSAGKGLSSGLTGLLEPAIKAMQFMADGQTGLTQYTVLQRNTSNFKMNGK